MMVTNPPFLIPCPMCKGVEGCDHTVIERAQSYSLEIEGLVAHKQKLEAGNDKLRAALERIAKHDYRYPFDARDVAAGALGRGVLADKPTPGRKTG
jgi:hypothetical protein